MKINSRLAVLFLCAFSVSVSGRPNTFAQSQARPTRVLQPLAAKLEPSRKVVYKSLGRRDLELHVFEPEGHDPATDRRPCFLIIHGGGWTGGEPRVFYTIADHYAKKGMLAISLQYRLIDAKAGVTVFDCVKDGRSAVRWLRAHAPTLGIDPKRIAVSGGSAGGHVALGTAVFENGPDVDESTDDLSVSCVPDLLIPLNPVIDTSEDGYGQGKIGDRWRALSPLHHVKRGLPPMLICHSTGDTVTPYVGAARFVELSKAAGNDCQMFTFEGGRHGWFIFNLDHYAAVLRVMDDYLKEQNFLSREPASTEIRGADAADTQSN
ncbi:MAG: alpha/beta hydrolase [Fuerstiella sp.]|nr:alpha/beta hydrolase [Fuerstiella sp.]MCP4854801.1 alpha/beta hydrolase [Fuerstiella sp.]